LEEEYVLHIEKAVTYHIFKTIQVIMLFSGMVAAFYAVLNKKVGAGMAVASIAFMAPFLIVTTTKSSLWMKEYKKILLLFYGVVSNVGLVKFFVDPGGGFGDFVEAAYDFKVGEGETRLLAAGETIGGEDCWFAEDLYVL